MGTTRDDIRRWLEAGVERGATHVIVATDTYDWGDYPIYVMPGEDPRKVAATHEKVMECYSLRLDLESQLHEHRAFHWD